MDKTVPSACKPLRLGSTPTARVWDFSRALQPGSTVGNDRQSTSACSGMSLLLRSGLLVDPAQGPDECPLLVTLSVGQQALSVPETSIAGVTSLETWTPLPLRSGWGVGRVAGRAEWILLVRSPHHHLTEDPSSTVVLIRYIRHRHMHLIGILADQAPPILDSTTERMVS